MHTFVTALTLHAVWCERWKCQWVAFHLSSPFHRRVSGAFLLPFLHALLRRQFIEFLLSSICFSPEIKKVYSLPIHVWFIAFLHALLCRLSVESLLSAICPNDLLRHHFPLLGMTLTRPILYLAGYMGIAGRHVGEWFHSWGFAQRRHLCQCLCSLATASSLLRRSGLEDPHQAIAAVFGNFGLSSLRPCMHLFMF